MSAGKKRRYMELLLEQPPFVDAKVASDYSAILLSTTKLHDEKTEPLQFQITLSERYEVPMPAESADDNTEIQAARVRKTITIKVRFNKAYSLREIFDFVTTSNTSYADKEDVRQAINIIIESSANRAPNISNAGKNDMYPFSDPLVQPHSKEEMHVLGQGLTAYRGYSSSVRLGAKRVLVNIQPQTRAMYNHGPVPELIKIFFNHESRPTGRQCRELTAFLKGVRVLSTHTGTRRVYTICAVAMGPGQRLLTPADIKFTLKDESTNKSRQTNVQEYFNERYKLKLSGDGMVLNCGNSQNPRYIPAQLCTVYAGQPAKRTLTEQQTREILRFAARRPNANQKDIQQSGIFVLGVDSEAQASTIGAFGLSLIPKMLTVPGRIINPPRLSFGQGIRSMPGDGGWNLAGKAFFKAGTIASMGVLLLAEYQVENSEARVNGILSHFMRSLGKYNISVKAAGYKAMAKVQPLNNSSSADHAITIRRHLEAASKQGTTMMLISIPRRDAKLYSIIKRIGDIDYGIHTIVLQQSNFFKFEQDPGLVANIALKVCAKSGGLCWTPEEHYLKPFDKETMLVGIDVSHPSPGSKVAAPSIAAVCASYDAQLTGYPGEVVQQERRVEMVTRLKDLIKGRLEFFRKKNQGRLPRKIIVYRDGVSEGQFHLLLDEEYNSMLGAFKDIYGAEKNYPKVTIIVVGKRHTTRFYPTSEEDMDPKSLNTRPGTAVDRHVTGYGERVWDFFLQPHKALQGTAKPMHCIVIKNENGYGIELERMTHSLCYLWHRATKAVSIPPPAYYADKLAERGRVFLHDLFNEELSETASSGSTASQLEFKVHDKLKDTMFYI